MSNETTRSSDQSRLENVAAISAVFHGDRRYRTFYNCQTTPNTGFIEIWFYMVTAAEAFRAAEEEMMVTLHDGWVDAIDGFVDELIIANRLLKPEELKQTALEVIQAALDKWDDDQEKVS